MRKLLAAVMAIGLVAAVSAQNLTVAVNWAQTDQVTKGLQQVAADFNAANKGVKVEVVSLPEYETTMKTKMAAKDLPDIWSTHGWSVMRYSEYLEPLTKQAWASKINPTIKPTITDEKGNVFVLPMNVDLAGVVFNKGVLDAAGVDPMKIKTMDDFKAACEKIKKSGKIAVHIGGNVKNDWTVGGFYDWTAPPYLITSDKMNYRKQLVDGSFDWNNWKPVAKLLVDFRDAGYLNPDYTQGTWEDVINQMGKSQVGFFFGGNSMIIEAKKVDAKAKFGFIPIPAAVAGDSPTVITGERVALGVWKDGKNKALALKFLAFAAQAKYVNMICNLEATPTGLVGTGYAAELGDLKPYFDAVKNLRGFPYFDRAYLPSGMWDSMCKTGTGLLSNTMTLDQAVAKMRDDYTNLRGN